jgi:hypothetical protein
MFVTVMIGRRQLMMDLKRRREGCHREQHAGDEKSNNATGFHL